MTLRERLVTAVLSMLAIGLVFTGTAQADDPAFRSSPTVFSFGDIVLGQQYGENYDYVELYPTSEAEVEITSISVVGPDAAAFDFSDGGCIGSPLDPDWGCQIYLSFTPGTVGLKEASLKIESNAPEKLVPLTANVIEPAVNAPVFRGGPAETGALPDPDADYRTTGMGSADFDGDGIADVVTNNQVETQFPWMVELGVAFGQSDGSLSEPVSYPAGDFSSTNLVVGDFDGADGPDIISLSAGQANVFLNDGEGAFTAAEPVVAGSGSSFISPGDFNEDGNLDFTVTDFSLIEVFLGDGEGGFTKAGEQSTGSEDDFTMGATTEIADFRGDGSNDFAITNYDGEVNTFLSDGDGTFTKGPVVRLGGCRCKNPWGIAPTDLNGDGRDDLTVAIFAESQVATLIAQPDGSMVLSQTNTNPLSPDGYDTTPKMVGNGDLNGDGIADTVSVDYNGDSITVYSGLASGTGFQFGDHLSMPGVADGRYIAPSQIAIEDFNGDGKNDVIVGGEFGKNVLFINDGQPGQVLSPTSLDFGEVVSGTTSPPKTIELTNEDGLAPLVVNNVTIGGGSSADFAISDATDCLDRAILVGDSCGVEVVFQPNGPPGERSSAIAFDTNNGDVTQVSATLTGDAASDVPSVSVAPTEVDFGSVTVGQTAQAPGIALTNDGLVPVETDTVTLDGANIADFGIGNDCTDKVLAPAESCTITASFSPKAVGARSASVNIASNVDEAPISVPLGGVGVAAPVLVPQISVSPSSLAFADTQVGSGSAAKSLVVSSTGTAPLVINGSNLSGANPGDFSQVSNNCPGTLQPGATCSIAYGFKPTAAGARSASVAIASNAAAGTANVPLGGTATAKPAPKPAPKVTFKKKPRKKYVIKAKKLRKVKIAFKSNQAGSRFQCRIDRKKFSPCKSPKVFRNIKPGKHVIKVRAVKSGKTGPAKVAKFKVVRKRR